MRLIKVFDLIFRRRLVLIGALVVLLVVASATVGLNLFRNSRKAKAVDFVANENQLIVPENQLLYIGGYGYTSQRLFSSIAEPINYGHQIASSGVTAPPNHVYNRITALQSCSPDIKSAWGSNLINCYLIVGDSTGMILRYNQSIDIYGTVVIGDRVVFESANINIHNTGKIYANGQNNQLGAANDTNCGAGGIGGINGGTNATNLNSTAQFNGVNFVACRGEETSGGPSTDPNFPSIAGQNLKDINSDVRGYFTVNSSDVTGGNGSNSSLPFTTEVGTPAGFGASSAIGVGGGGGGGSTGSGDHDRAPSSGGGGGGFGLVLKSDSLSVNSAAVITAAGGNSTVDPDNLPQYNFPSPNLDPAGAFGGPGGGGVIIINSSSIQFRSGDSDQTEALSNYSIFNTKAGILSYPSSYYIAQGIDDRWIKIPPGAADGKLVINADSEIVSIRKSVVNCGDDNCATSHPNYVFRPGDNIVVTLTVYNLTPNTRYTIDDEIFSDGVNLGSTVDTISDDGVQNGLKVTWSLFASDTVKTLSYKLIVN